MSLPRVCPEFVLGQCETARILVESGGGDGLKNRRLRQCKILIGEVLISATLTLRGEVAERLKAAVC